MQYISYLDIINHIDRIKEGDIVYLISDIRPLVWSARMNGEQFDSNLFIDSIQKKIGPNGTLLIPVFNWDFCKGITFDYKNTRSKTGALGNIALKRSDFKRTKHPIYSFMVWGKDTDLLVNLNNINSFGIGTPFDYMYQNNAKALMLGINALVGFTILHYSEEVIGVSYRYEKYFTADYIDESGEKTQKKYSMYVRDLDLNVNVTLSNENNPLVRIYNELNITNRTKINDVSICTAMLHAACDIGKYDILYNKSKGICEYIGQN